MERGAAELLRQSLLDLCPARQAFEPELGDTKARVAQQLELTPIEGQGSEDPRPAEHIAEGVSLRVHPLQTYQMLVISEAFVPGNRKVFPLTRDAGEARSLPFERRQ